MVFLSPAVFCWHQISLRRKVQTFPGKMVNTLHSDEEKGIQDKESKEESILAMLGIIGTILNLLVIIFVYIYTTLWLLSTCGLITAHLDWTPWEPHWKNPAWLVVDWSQSSAIVERRPPGLASDGHPNLPASSLHRQTHPGYACDSITCTVTDTFQAVVDRRRTAPSLLSDGIISLAYLPHAYLISFSQCFFVSVHICIGFKRDIFQQWLFLYSISQCFFRELSKMRYNLMESIHMCAVNINLL